MELYNCLSIKVIRQPICRHEQLSLSETLSGSRLFECVARVKAAWVELSENVSDKSGCVFVQLLTPKADLRTDGAERIRIANRPCQLVQST